MQYTPYYDSIVFADFLYSPVYSKFIYNGKRQLKAKSGNKHLPKHLLFVFYLLIEEEESSLNKSIIYFSLN